MNKFSKAVKKNWEKIGDYKYPVVIFMVWRIWVIIVARLSFSSVIVKNPTSIDGLKTALPAWLATTVSYDSGWYYSIAHSGYPKILSPVFAFYPLYPLLVSVYSHTLKQFALTSFIINMAAALLATVFLFLLAKNYFNDKTLSVKVVISFLVFPTAFFLTMAYGEAVFCALAFAAFFFARKRVWWLSCILLGFLTAARLPALAVAAAIFVEYASSIEFKVSKLNKQVLWFLLAPLGFVIYAVYLHIHAGNAFLMFDAYKTSEWAYQHFQANIFKTILVYGYDIIFTKTHSDQIFGYMLWIIAAIVTYVMRKKLPLSYTTLMVVSLVLFIVNGNFVSVNRYILPLFPLYIGFVQLTKKYPTIYLTAIVMSAMLLGIQLLLFVNGYWVA